MLLDTTIEDHFDLTPDTFLPSTPPSFKHQPLNPIAREIRLLLVTADDNDGIHYHLFIFPLCSAPAFRALSYTWGPSSPSQQITLNDALFSVSPNLHAFLGVYSEKFAGDYIWCDQICIDQSNTSERNHQVHLMSSIYQSAIEVLVWISPVDASTGRIVSECDASCRETHFKHTGPRCRWLTHILGNVYWTRLWIFQEIVLARELRFLIGAGELHWHDLLDIERFGGFGDKYADRCPPQFTWLIREFGRSHRGEMGLMDAVRYCAGSGCKDARDKVFGLQALIREEERVRVDYSLQVEEVFLEVVVQVRTQLGNVMSDCDRGDLAALAKSMDVDWGKYNAITRGEQARDLTVSGEQRELDHVQMPEQDVREIRGTPRPPSPARHDRFDDSNYRTPPWMYDQPSPSYTEDFDALEHDPENHSQHELLLLQQEAENPDLSDPMELSGDALEQAQLQHMIAYEEGLDQHDVCNALEYRYELHEREECKQTLSPPLVAQALISCPRALVPEVPQTQTYSMLGMSSASGHTNRMSLGSGIGGEKYKYGRPISANTCNDTDAKGGR